MGEDQRPMNAIARRRHQVDQYEPSSQKYDGADCLPQSRRHAALYQGVRARQQCPQYGRSARRPRQEAEAASLGRHKLHRPPWAQATPVWGLEP